MIDLPWLGRRSNREHSRKPHLFSQLILISPFQCICIQLSNKLPWGKTLCSVYMLTAKIANRTMELLHFIQIAFFFLLCKLRSFKWSPSTSVYPLVNDLIITIKMLQTQVVVRMKHGVTFILKRCRQFLVIGIKVV
jgi:hypothetical protein